MEYTAQSQDPWRPAILSERRSTKIFGALEAAMHEYSGKRDNALILGDASLIQTLFLLEQGFEHVVDIDISPTLLDDEIIRASDSRVTRIVSAFDDYYPGDDRFDLIFGKSIAFNPKETIEALMQRLCASLNNGGLIIAEWGAEGDSYRRGIAYTEEELRALYDTMGLTISSLRERRKPVIGLLGRPGIAHTFIIVATK